MEKKELAVTYGEKIKHIRICIQNIVFGDPHEHNALELGVVLRGTVKVQCQDSEYCIPAGGLLLFNAYDTHTVSAVSEETPQVLYLQVSTTFCREYLARLSNVAFDSKALHSLPPQSMNAIRQRLLSCAYTYFQETVAFQLDCVGQISLLLAELLREVPHRRLTDTEIVVRKNNRSRMQRIADYIEQHYRQKLTLSDLAAVEDVSAAYMSRVFGQLFHMPFQTYLMLLRLDKALPLLRDDTICLVDVCLECGFSDTKYLNAVCRKVLGCSAAEYRAGGQARDIPAVAWYSKEAFTETTCSDRDSLQLLETTAGSLYPEVTCHV